MKWTKTSRAVCIGSPQPSAVADARCGTCERASSAGGRYFPCASTSIPAASDAFAASWLCSGTPPRRCASERRGAGSLLRRSRRRRTVRRSRRVRGVRLGCRALRTVQGSVRPARGRIERRGVLAPGSDGPGTVPDVPPAARGGRLAARPRQSAVLMSPRTGETRGETWADSQREAEAGRSGDGSATPSTRTPARRSSTRSTSARTRCARVVTQRLTARATRASR